MYLRKWWMLCLVLVIFSMQRLDALRYPSIVWNPYNPIFACDNPTLHVKINDNVKFICPYTDGGFLIPPAHDNPIYENLYYLGTNVEQYNTCNATGAKQLLNCDGNEKSTQLLFEEYKSSVSSILFKPGETHHLIGTGFRQINQLNNMIGGSCNTTENVGADYKQYKMRLKIYICTNDDITKGLCNTCDNSGCYSQGSTCLSKTETAAKHAKDENEASNISLMTWLIITTILSLFVGCACGIFIAHKYHHKKRCLNGVRSHDMKGNDNSTFVNDSK